MGEAPDAELVVAGRATLIPFSPISCTRQLPSANAVPCLVAALPDSFLSGLGRPSVALAGVRGVFLCSPFWISTIAYPSSWTKQRAIGHARNGLSGHSRHTCLVVFGAQNVFVGAAGGPLVASASAVGKGTQHGQC